MCTLHHEDAMEIISYETFSGQTKNYNNKTFANKFSHLTLDDRIDRHYRQILILIDCIIAQSI